MSDTHSCPDLEKLAELRRFLLQWFDWSVQLMDSVGQLLTFNAENVKGRDAFP